MNTLNSQVCFGCFFQSTLFLMVIYYFTGRLLTQAFYVGYDVYSRWTDEINPCGFRKKIKILVINVHLGEDSSLSFP